MIKKNIPNLLTMGNLFCGLVGLIRAFEGDYEYALYWVFLGIVFDFFDGMAARALKVSSKLGLELDSLSDVVTSGVVPGVVMYKVMSQTTSSDILPYAGFIITLASAFRLGRFNLDTRQSSSFIGLPTPANCLFICSLAVVFVVYSPDFLKNYWVLLSISALSAYVMNSEIPLFALKFKTLDIGENLQKIVFLSISAVLFIFLQIPSIPLIIIFYILLSLAWPLFQRK